MDNIVVVGSSLDDKGGIVTVMKNIESSNLKNEFNFIHVSTYNTCKLLEKIKVFLKGLYNILGKVKKKDMNVFHIHMSYKGSFYRKSIIILITKLFRKKVIVHMHGSCFEDFYDEMNIIGRLYCNYIFRKIDKLIVLSDSWKRFFETFVESNKIVVINNSVSIDKYYLKDSNKSNDIIKFVFLGRLGKRKGVYDLLDVFENISKSTQYKEKFKLILAGDGEIDKVNKIIKEKNLDNYVENKGWISGNEKESLLIDSHIFILPSYNEGLPMSILEAMSYKLACISTNVGGIPEVINHGIDGLLYNCGDNETLYKYIKDILDGRYDLTTMGNKAFENVSNNFNQEKEFDKIKDLYEELNN